MVDNSNETQELQEVIGDDYLNFTLEYTGNVQVGDRVCRVSVWNVGGEYGTYES